MNDPKKQAAENNGAFVDIRSYPGYDAMNDEYYNSAAYSLDLMRSAGMSPEERENREIFGPKFGE